MSVRWLLALLLVLAVGWVLRTWLLWDRRRGHEGGAAAHPVPASEPVPSAFADGEGESGTDGGTDSDVEAERRAERSRQALRERGEQVLEADRVSGQGARLAWLERTLARIEDDPSPSPGQGVETSRLRGELAALPRGEELPEAALRSLERRVESLRVASEPASEETNRPALFETPQERDDLKQIKGIGPVMEGVLNSHGVTTFRQLANFTAEDIERVSEAIGTFPGRIERDDWVGRAKRLLARREKERTT